MPPHRRGAPLKPLADATGLGEARIDVGVRIGWTLRTARLTLGEGRVTQADMVAHLQAAGLPSSGTSVHRAETGVHRSGAVIDVWERAVGLPAATLRAPVDVLCRTFPYAQPDQDPGRVPATLEEMEAVLAPVGAGEATGGQWLRWARAVVHVGGLGLGRSVADELVARCLSEMGRATGTGYHARYEALSLLRCSRYGEVVLDAARAEVADPHVQVLYDLMSLVGEAYSETAMRWAAARLLDEREHVVIGAALCLENMVAVEQSPGRLVEVADELVEAWHASEPGTTRRHWVTHLVRLMPPDLHAVVRARLTGPLPPTPASAPPTAEDEPWATCVTHGDRIARDLGLDPQPVLARLLHDLAFSPYETRGVTTGMLLCAQPALAGPVADVVVHLAEEHPRDRVRARSLRRIGMLEGGAAMPERMRGWLADDDGPRLAAALRYAGVSDVEVDVAVLDRAVAAGGEAQRAAVRWAGMRRSPELDRLLVHPDPDVAGASRWWQRHGGLVVDREERS